MTNNKQLNKLNIFIIKYPFSQVIIILITYIIIRVSFISSIAMCEGWDPLIITRIAECYDSHMENIENTRILQAKATIDKQLNASLGSVQPVQESQQELEDLAAELRNEMQGLDDDIRKYEDELVSLADRYNVSTNQAERFSLRKQILIIQEKVESAIKAKEKVKAMLEN